MADQAFSEGQLLGTSGVLLCSQEPEVENSFPCPRSAEDRCSVGGLGDGGPREVWQVGWKSEC